MIEVDFRRQVPGLEFDIRFSAPGDGVTALFGRSGAGKSTIVEVIGGATRDVRGRIAINERVFLDTELGIWLPVEERRIGFVFQNSRLFPHMTVKANLLFGYRRARVEPFIAPDQAIALLGLDGLVGRRPHDLSGGERQRVAIGRAILAQPALLLLDEPLSSLDPPRKAELLPYIERLRDELEIPMIYISHDFNEVMRLADTLVVVDGGRVARHGPLIELASDPELSPLLGRYEAGSVIACTVAGHDKANGLTQLELAGQAIVVPLIDAEVGSGVRVRLRARDVALALSEPADTSIANRLPGTITELVPRDEPFVDAGVDLGGVVVRSLLTRGSVERLGLRPGMAVWALIRIVALDSRSVGFMRLPRHSNRGGDAC